MSTPNDNKPVCPNCGQYQHKGATWYRDCMNECTRRGFAAKPPQPSPAAVEQRKLSMGERYADIAAEAAEAIASSRGEDNPHELDQAFVQNAVEQALAQEKANQEKIGATVQAAKDSPLTAPIDWQAAASEAANRYYNMKQERDTLQAQRDELLAEAKCMLRELNNCGITCSKWDAAIARATKGGTGQ